MSNDNAWKWWQDALAGNFGPIHDSDPQQGYYRTRFKEKPWEPVAIWFENGEWHAMRGDRTVRAADIWTWCCRNPITYEAYTKAIEGDGWDDEPEAVRGMGDNLPDDPFEALKLEFAGEQELAAELLRTKVETQDQANKIGVLSKRIASISKRASDLHKVEKAPHLEAGRAVDDKWRDLKEEPDSLSKRLKRHLDDYLREQQRLEMERQRKAQEEADRKRREAEDAASAAAQQENEAAAVEAKRLQDEAAQAERDAQARNASAGRTGARVALRTFVYAQITDYDALLMALKDRAEIKEIVETLAHRAARSGVELPGMGIRSEQRAA
ncbi:hypothetical protein REJC140_00157 [Pseudorhizobium endolithicum]|uniref:Uncharacterized protein n=1 Tax=Pseudorhizobium endolithicum TaxID=1191678 RepID=A0ABM8PCU7_9HYPH|nr:hypothetical protein [Pseudorhizobium endolithicum]CAD7023292.1 hypothetical protein REJC140_00157 [Pseudorhizobium endolithicum]